MSNEMEEWRKLTLAAEEADERASLAMPRWASDNHCQRARPIILDDNSVGIELFVSANSQGLNVRLTGDEARRLGEFLLGIPAIAPGKPG